MPQLAFLTKTWLTDKSCVGCVESCETQPTAGQGFHEFVSQSAPKLQLYQYDPWDKESLILEPDQYDSEGSPDNSKVKSIERSSELASEPIIKLSIIKVGVSNRIPLQTHLLKHYSLKLSREK